MTPVARYDSVAEFYVAEIGDSLNDDGTAGLLELVGDVRGTRICDIACGQGRVTRELARRGATVTGVDVSAELLERARAAERQEPLGTDYVHGDISTIRELQPRSFDGAVCNFGLSDIDDLSGALNAVATLLRPGGSFIFSILHPCFPGWGADVSSSWRPGSGYFTEGWWRTDAASSKIRQRVGANHRMLSTYLNELSRHGLAVDRVLEPPPPEHWRAAEPSADPTPPTWYSAPGVRRRVDRGVVMQRAEERRQRPGRVTATTDRGPVRGPARNPRRPGPRPWESRGCRTQPSRSRNGER